MWYIQRERSCCKRRKIVKSIFFLYKIGYNYIGDNMKRGFTLVELISAVLVMALISITVIPSILNLVNKKQDEISDLSKEILFLSADHYFTSNDITYPRVSGNTYCVTLNKLVEMGELSAPIKDLKTDTEIALNTTIKATLNVYGDYDYCIVNENDENCNMCLDNSIKDDYRILAVLAELNPNDYNSIDSLFASSTAISAIVSHKQAIDYIISSEGEMKEKALAKESVMTALFASEYGYYSILLNNDWYTSIQNGSYKNTFNAQAKNISKMTSNNTCEDSSLCGTASASDSYTEPYLAFDTDKTFSGSWRSTSKNPASSSEYLQFEFDEPVLIFGYKFYLYNMNGYGMYYNGTTNLQLLYSLDGENWTEILTSKLSAGTEYANYFNEAYKAKYVRLKITGINSYFSYTSTSYWYQITETNFMFGTIPE